VLIQVSVLGDGRVGSARVASSSGHGSLDRAALKAVKRWRFRPALRGGKPVTATLMVPVVFRLEG
jgi:protein TonB